MERPQRDVVLLTLIEQLQARGSWCGETHIQKTGFFLQELLGVSLGFDFILYKHGPYSFDLSDTVTALVGDQLLAVVVRAPQYGPSLLPGENSAAFLRRFPVTRARYGRQIQFVAERLARKNVAELEKLATALYVTRKDDRASSVASRAKEINKLKPHIDLSEARSAVADVDAIMEDAKAVTSS